MCADSLLVVAPHGEPYGSFISDLAAEGLLVTLRNEVPSIAWSQANRFDCTILDRQVLPSEEYRAIAFCIKAFPVVLVTSEPVRWLDDWVAHTIGPPSTTRTLLDAVEKAQSTRLRDQSGRSRELFPDTPGTPPSEPK